MRIPTKPQPKVYLLIESRVPARHGETGGSHLQQIQRWAGGRTLTVVCGVIPHQGTWATESDSLQVNQENPEGEKGKSGAPAHSKNDALPGFLQFLTSDFKVNMSILPHNFSIDKTKLVIINLKGKYSYWEIIWYRKPRKQYKWSNHHKTIFSRNFKN